MKYLAAALVVALCACGETVTERAVSSADAAASPAVSTTVSSNTSNNVSSSVNSGSSTSITSSTNVGGTTQSSSSNNSTSSCSTELNGKRCEIACRLPQVAQCTQRPNATEPSCFCK